MAQPKRRWSKARTGAKRSTWKLEEENLSVCSHCGYYDGKEVVAKKEKKND